MKAVSALYILELFIVEKIKKRIVSSITIFTVIAGAAAMGGLPLFASGTAVGSVGGASIGVFLEQIITS